MTKKINRYYIAVFLMILLLLLYFFFSTDAAISIFTFKPSPEYTNLNQYIENILDYDRYMVEGFASMQFVLPTIISLGSLYFFTIKKGFLIHSYTRQDDYKKNIIFIMVKIALSISVAVFLGYLVYALIGMPFFKIKIDLDSTRETFADLIGINFYLYHRYAFYLFEGLLKCIPFSFVYSMFSMSIILFLEKKSLAVLIPTIFYFIMIPLLSILPSFQFKQYLYPGTILIPGAMSEPVTVALFSSFIIPIIIIITLIIIRFKNKEVLGY